MPNMMVKLIMKVESLLNIAMEIPSPLPSLRIKLLACSDQWDCIHVSHLFIGGPWLLPPSLYIDKVASAFFPNVLDIF